MKKVIIIGGDIAGLLCAYLFKKYGVEVKVIEPGLLGENFIDGGLEFIYNTQPITTILNELDILYSDYNIHGGILLRDKIEKYPAYFKNKKIKKVEVQRIKSDYFRKTRLVKAIIDNPKKAISDLLETTRSKRAVRMDNEELVFSLSKNLNIIKATPLSIDDSNVLTTRGKFKYDFLVFTQPLWVLKDLVDWYVPYSLATKLNTVTVIALGHKYIAYDYILTPYTPSDHIHRFFSYEQGFKMEISGELDYYKLQSDLNFIFKNGWYLKDIKQDLFGFLLPLENKVQWPYKIAPLGRFAKWDQKITLDTTLVEIIELAKKWFG